ncbi:sugar phosphate isomerase/epimerase family protein [Nocardiopsis suaedae]|uniref:Sugar phosphate isomerase/epimerase n=1 Tax=Nocardiopsis suaedae TaxID=3018444 RepID=A0ABT4TS03_9ACTN|nr:sugar phosphate isomerase/epimerase [Nocardiopsis suaedae]MDA2807458.1 sugar phosphate isomerase/epimerase [Nocardiopsis suaedae]
MARIEFDRRGFLGTVAAGTVAVGAGTVMGASPAGAAGGGRVFPKGRIGIQLYSIRDKVAELGFARVFEELSRMGYAEVELAGYTQPGVGPITVEEIRRLLDENGLRAAGTHVGLDAWMDDPERELDSAEVLGVPYAGTASAPTDDTTVAGYRAAAEEFNRIGALAADRGIGFFQHNHHWEFAFADDEPQTRLYDVFLENTDPALVYLEMDVYWAFVGQHVYPGFEPVEYVLAHPERYPLFHVKDGDENPDNPLGYDIIEFGAGDLPYAEFFSRVRGCPHTLWEQDNAPDSAVPPHPVDSLGNAERSYRAMRELRRPVPGRGHGHGRAD